LKKKNENILLLEKENDTFSLFRMNFHFKGVKSHSKKVRFHSFEMKIHFKKSGNYPLCFQEVEDDCILS